MIKLKSRLKKRKKIGIDLTGPDGNAFVLFDYASRFCKQLSKDFGPIQKDMTSGNYEHLIEVFDREFGDLVMLLYR